MENQHASNRQGQKSRYHNPNERQANRIGNRKDFAGRVVSRKSADIGAGEQPACGRWGERLHQESQPQ